MTPDADLVRRCLEGDRVAWSDLLARYGDLIHGLLRRCGLDGASAADAFQEISILLWKNLRRLRSAERLLPWIATTTRRVAWRVRRREKARDARHAAVARPERDPGPSPGETVAALEEEQAVRQALSALAERCRRLLVALYFQPGPASYDQIADRLGLPRGSLGPTRARCLEALRRELTALGFESPVSPRPAGASSASGGRVRRPRRA